MIWNFPRNVSIGRIEREREKRDTLNFASFNCGGVVCRSVLNRRPQSDNVRKDFKLIYSRL